MAMPSDPASMKHDDRGARRGRARRFLAVVLAPLGFGALISAVATAFHVVDLANGDRWKSSWTEMNYFFLVMAYVGSLLPGSAVVTILFLKAWKSDATKVMGIFSLTCILMALVWTLGIRIAAGGVTLADVPGMAYVAALVTIPGLLIPGCYCLIAGVPWRMSRMQ